VAATFVVWLQTAYVRMSWTPTWRVYTLQGLDIGPDSVKLIQDTLADAQTVLWNGAHPASRI
jgi:3-phosphoglycerate kinase